MICDNCKNHSDKKAIWPPCKLDIAKDEELAAFDPDDNEIDCPRFDKITVIECKNCINFKPVQCKYMEANPELSFGYADPLIINQHTKMSWCDGYGPNNDKTKLIEKIITSS
jgi:hypothetical protein